MTNILNQLGDLLSIKSYKERIESENRHVEVKANSINRLSIGEKHGIFKQYWSEYAAIRFEKNGECKVHGEYKNDYAPTSEECCEFITEFGNYEFPTVKPLHSLRDIELPEELAQANSSDVYTFRNTDGQIIMLQQRVSDEKGKYRPWTYWSDDKWRMTEPDFSTGLPLYNMDRLKDHSVVFIHEGAKAAHAVQRMIDKKTFQLEEKFNNHPWADWLKSGVHVGWIGGATNPHRTDWSILKKLGFAKAIIVADNDNVGKQAIPRIAQHLDMVTFALEFNHDFPVSFDLADDFPDAFFSEGIDGKPRYIGLGYKKLLHPATFMTKQIPPKDGKKGRPATVLREHAKPLWAYIEECDQYVCTEMPNVIRSGEVLNKMLSSFSHTQNVAQLINKSYRGRSVTLCYRPDKPELLIDHNGKPSVNIYTPPDVHPSEGDPSPFLEYMDYMFPNPEENHQAKRWIATLIAKPDIRIEYGMLLVTEHTGIGKTTLCEEILQPLLGHDNVGWPTENDVSNSQFNDWIANKRLAVVNEIYASHSWATYHKLKGLITDKSITVNKKYERPYVVDNWCHIIACSNTHRALKMESDDRRWFYPAVTEQKWPREKFKALREWLKSGGIQIILQWALDFGDYVLPGERAPMSENKANAIDGSRSEGQREAADLAEAMESFGLPCAVSMKDIMMFLEQQVRKLVDKDYEIRKTMCDCGCKVFSRRIKIGGRAQYVLINSDLQQKIEGLGDKEALPAVRSSLVKCNQIIETDI
jgi:hypothetical protein